MKREQRTLTIRRTFLFYSILTLLAMIDGRFSFPIYEILWDSSTHTHTLRRLFISFIYFPVGPIPENICSQLKICVYAQVVRCTWYCRYAFAEQKPLRAFNWTVEHHVPRTSYTRVYIHNTKDKQHCYHCLWLPPVHSIRRKFSHTVHTVPCSMCNLYCESIARQYWTACNALSLEIPILRKTLDVNECALCARCSM